MIKAGKSDEEGLSSHILAENVKSFFEEWRNDNKRVRDSYIELLKNHSINKLGSLERSPDVTIT